MMHRKGTQEKGHEMETESRSVYGGRWRGAQRQRKDAIDQLMDGALEDVLRVSWKFLW